MTDEDELVRTQGIHHITFMGADRQTSIDFWEGVLGMPFIFEQPNLDDHSMNHLYFDPGDGRLITIFTSEDWARDPRPTPQKQGSLHHLAFTVTKATYDRAGEKLRALGFAHSGNVDRGFMDSLYFRDPLGQLFELACYKFEPPTGLTHADVLRRAHDLRKARGAINIELIDLQNASEELAHGV
jgi:glyoxalase family protein